MVEKQINRKNLIWIIPTCLVIGAMIIYLINPSNISHYSINLDCDEANVSGFTEIELSGDEMIAVGENQCNPDGLCLRPIQELGKTCEISVTFN